LHIARKVKQARCGKVVQEIGQACGRVIGREVKQCKGEIKQT